MRAHTTGTFAVFSRHHGKDVTPKGRKARALLAYLVCDPGARIPKGLLADLLWLALVLLSAATLAPRGVEAEEFEGVGLRPAVEV